MRNYLARLGWGHGDDEIFSDAQAAAWFDVADVGVAPARLDWAKLNHINSHYIRLADEARLADLTLKAHRDRDAKLPADALDRLKAAIPLVKEGAKTIPELADLTLFVLKDRPLALDARTDQALSDTETHARLVRLHKKLSSAAVWTPAALDTELKEFSAEEGVGLGKFGPALRGMLSGGATAPDLASALAALGMDESLGRLQDALFKATKTL
jgi:glutamyl-tRNA synthetase